MRGVFWGFLFKLCPRLFSVEHLSAQQHHDDHETKLSRLCFQQNSANLSIVKNQMSVYCNGFCYFCLHVNKTSNRKYFCRQPPKMRSLAEVDNNMSTPSGGRTGTDHMLQGTNYTASVHNGTSGSLRDSLTDLYIFEAALCGDSLENFWPSDFGLRQRPSTGTDIFCIQISEKRQVLQSLRIMYYIGCQC